MPKLGLSARAFAFWPGVLVFGFTPKYLRSTPAPTTMGAYANWNATSRWRVSPGYSFLHMHVEGDSSTLDPAPGAIANESPRNQLQLRPFLNLTLRLEWKAGLYHVGRLEDGDGGPTCAYARLDSRLGWRWGESLEPARCTNAMASARRFETISTNAAEVLTECGGHRKISAT